jgi:hemoglobin-like flavoprotein
MPKATIGRSIYQNMIGIVQKHVSNPIFLEKCPETKKLFNDDGGSIDRHTKYFVDLIQSAVENINDMETGLRPWLEMLGKGHAGFAIRYRVIQVNIQ